MLDNNAQDNKPKKDIAQSSEHLASEIVLKPLDQVIHESMMPYSEFVIMDRALPRVEDGLKPVQRRVLYSMLEVGVTPDKPYRKSARIVGDCMGKYHPHGDRSIYDTMVRMAQPFNMGECLVDGHGNFGSVDGDSAAAMRYTEARLSPISLELLRDIEKDTVSWSFNFDDSTKEPDMLPGRFPNLLVNGATGIAVGLATNIPTHNLGEVIDAVVAYIDNPKISVSDILKIMPAPDFSTGGYILSSSEIKQLYKTGKGKIIIRAKIEIEPGENGKPNLVITEIPYQVNKATLLQKIAKLNETSEDGDVLSNITEIVDESDRQGTRAVIKVKKDTNIPLLLKTLYRVSDLQTNFNGNMVAIAGGKPKQLTLLEIIEYYVHYQKEVVYKRTKFDLEVSEKREHILDGLLIAIKNIDDVIKIIKASKSTNEAKATLISTFYLSEVQAQAILDMRLARLTNLEVNKLINELKELRELIVKLKRILSSEKLQYGLVKSEMLEIKSKYATPRKSQLLKDDLDENLINKAIKQAEKAAEPEYVNIVYTAGNTIKCISAKNYSNMDSTLSDGASTVEVAQINIKVLNNKLLHVFTNLGNCHTIKVKDIPQSRPKDKGEFLHNLIKAYNPNERVVGIFDLSDYMPTEAGTAKEGQLLFVTKMGFIKIANISEYFATKQTISATKLKDKDEVVFIDYNTVESSMYLFTHQGFAIHFSKEDIATLGRVSVGFKGITLSEGDFVVNAYQVVGNTAFAVVCSNGYAKAIKSSEVVTLGRGRKGLKIYHNTDKTVNLLGAFILNKNTSYAIVLESGEVNFVLNKKLPLQNKQAEGKQFVKGKNKPVSVCEHTVI